MISISPHITLDDTEIDITFIKAQGSGGQNVNKVSTAVHLRFSISDSSLPEECKKSLLVKADQRITKEGIIIIKAQKYRTQEQNREDAITRLIELIHSVLVIRKKRKPTKATFGSKQRRLDIKSKRGKIKAMRKKVDY